MIRLFIDWVEVALSPDLQLELVSCNPFFTKKGEFTYDLDIDLRYPQNEQIYGHINRSDVLSRPLNREAAIINGPLTIIKGTEIILSVEGDIAKIQIVGGNSELNYLSGNGLRIREMDFGTITVDQTQAKKTLDGCYPQYNFVCPPVYTGYDTNAYTFDNRMNIQSGTTDYYPGTRISPQPYLLYYVEKMVELLGYTLLENFLREDRRWCRLYLVNGYDTYEYAKMLPDWTADEFITEIEKLFNCIFLVNHTNNTVRIVDIKSYYNSEKKIYISETINSMKGKNYNVDDNLYINYDNVSFDFPELTEYKYNRVNEEILKLCEVKEVDKYTDLWGQGDAAYDRHVIYHTKDYGLDFILVRLADGGLRQKIVNRFADIKGNIDGDTTLMKIVPAEIYAGDTAIGLGSAGIFTCAYARNANSLDDTTGDIGLNDMILNGAPEENVPDRIYVALYVGWVNLFSEISPEVHYPGYSLPMSATDIFYFITSTSALSLIKFDDEELTLTLLGDNGLYNRYYKGGIKINTDTECLSSFLMKERLDSKLIYVIENKSYYCKELRYKVSTTGMDNVVEGTFYPM